MDQGNPNMSTAVRIEQCQGWKAAATQAAMRLRKAGPVGARFVVTWLDPEFISLLTRVPSEDYCSLSRHGR
jgi:hypothetical protein